MLTASEIECALNARAQWEEKLTLTLKKRDDSLRYLNAYTNEQCTLYDTETSYLMVSSQFEREYTQAQHHLKRLKRLLFPTPLPKGSFTTNDITHAKQVPLEELVDTSKARTSSGKVVVSCPIGSHQDSSPSFTIYTNDNRYHCFGCQAHGDAITLVRQLHSLSFKDAVSYLLNHNRL